MCVPHDFLVSKLDKCGLNKITKMLIDIVSITMGKGHHKWINVKMAEVLSGVPQWVVLAPVLLNIFINNFDAEIELLSKFSDNVELGRIANTLEGRNGILKALEKLEIWAGDNRISSVK